MSLPEEAGKVITGTVDALKGSPVLLVLVLLQVFQLGVIYFASQGAQKRNQEREIAMLERCFPLNREKN